MWYTSDNVAIQVHVIQLLVKIQVVEVHSVGVQVVEVHVVKIQVVEVHSVGVQHVLQLLVLQLNVLQLLVVLPTTWTWTTCILTICTSITSST